MKSCFSLGFRGEAYENMISIFHFLRFSPNVKTSIVKCFGTPPFMIFKKYQNRTHISGTIMFFIELSQKNQWKNSLLRTLASGRPFFILIFSVLMILLSNFFGMPQSTRGSKIFQKSHFFENWLFSESSILKRFFEKSKKASLLSVFLDE